MKYVLVELLRYLKKSDMKIKKPVSLKSRIWGILLILPLVHIAACWGVGLVYNRWPIHLGPYKTQMEAEIHDAMKPGGEPYWSICSEKRKVESIQIRAADKKLGVVVDYAYEERPIGFLYPDFWFISFPKEKGWLGDGKYREQRFTILKAGYGFARAYNSDKKEQRYADARVEQVEEILHQGNNPKDLIKWKRYEWLRKFERSKFFWLVGNGLGNPFRSDISYRQTKPLEIGDYELFIFSDVLGIVGCLILWLSWAVKDLRLWFYYLFWVFAYWFGRVGFWAPNMAFKIEGWLAMFYNCFDWVLVEGRLFLLLAIVLSVPLILRIGFVYLTRHLIPRIKRGAEDLMKVDKDKEKRKETAIDSVEFKEVKFDIAKKLQGFARRQEYFLGLDDDKKDITIKEQMLTYHVHIMGSTGSGKTSLGILPLGHQALEKGRGCCFVDFKGDEVLKKYLQQKTLEKGKKFYYFSFDSTENSIAYNPLLSGDIDSKVDRIMSALELIYEGPAGFYSNVQAMVFRDLLEIMVNEKQEITFATVKDALTNKDFLAKIDAEPREIKGLVAAISRLAKIVVINSSQIDLSAVIKSGDVMFFALKSQLNTQLAEALGKMLIIDLKAQAARRSELDPPFFIFIDEFQNLACKHFVDVISKIRSANFCLVLSNQSRGNLMTVSPGFENAIFDNTATKVIFNQENPSDAGFWSDKSGQTTYQEKNTLQFDGRGVDGEKTMLDGKRSSQGSIFTARKNYISSNIFLKLPFSKSVVFVKGELARIANHAFLFDRAERDKLLSRPFVYEELEVKDEPVGISTN